MQIRNQIKNPSKIEFENDQEEAEAVEEDKAAVQ